MPQDEIERLLVEHGARRATRRAAEGRRPVRVRARRRGGRGAARRRDRVRGRARGHRGRRRAGLRRDPGHPPRRWPARSPSSPATRIPTSPSRRSTGRRWPRSRARSSSTWASGSSTAIAERLIAGGRARDEPAAVDRARHAARPARRRGDAGDDRRARPRDEGIRAPAIAVFGPVAALRERLALVRAPAAARA